MRWPMHWWALRSVKSFFIVMLLSLTSCRKDDSLVVFQLPPATQLGRNTFGFLKDGNVWTNYGEVCFTFGCQPNLQGYYFKSDGSVLVRADRVLYRKGDRFSESIYLEWPTNYEGIRTYSTTAGDLISASYYPEDDESQSYIVADSLPNFTVRLIRLDTTNKIISGTFYGTLFKRTNNGLITSRTDSVRITEGRFDVRY